MKDGASNDCEKTCPVHPCHAVHVSIVSLVQLVVQDFRNTWPLGFCQCRLVHSNFENQMAPRNDVSFLYFAYPFVMIIYVLVGGTPLEAMKLNGKASSSELTEIFLEW